MNITFFILYCSLIIISPGPTNIMIFSITNNLGVQRALSFCYGSMLAFNILVFGSALFNSFLLSFLPGLLIYLRIIGAFYMIYLAYQILKSDLSFSLSFEVGSFKMGFLIQILNPKGILFCLTVFPTFITPFYNTIEVQLLFALLLSFIGTIAFFIWVLFGRLLKKLLSSYQRVINSFMALFLVYSAVLISGIMDYI
ncbi:LysE family translocator [Campylobacterota bacterium DY0563]